MRRSTLMIVLLASSGAAHAQTRGADTITRDLAPNPGTVAPGGADRPVVQAALPPVVESNAQANAGDGILIGAVQVEGASDVAREAFAPVIADYLGKEASARDLQGLAKAVASVARSRGYVFASAVVPRQTMQAGTIKVTIDEGRIDSVRITGSANRRLRHTLDRLVGRGVRRDVLERQLLLAGDIPGIEVVSTRLAREDIGSVLIVEVRERRGNGSVAVDNFGAHDLGPVRARLRYDFTGLAEDDDVLSAQAVVTPLDPSQIAYLTMRYAVALGTAGAQVGVTASLGRAEPSGSGFRSTSRAVAVFASIPVKRANAASVWANAELGVLRVDGKQDGLAVQRDSIAVATGWLYATTRLGTGRVSGGLGMTQGIALSGTTALGDTRASRPDGSATFTKGFFWTDWDQPIGAGFAMKISASGQIANRPLLAPQEVGVGGPSFGRAFNFSERFGDSGFMGSAELRHRWQGPIGGIDWVEPYAYADGGRVWNLNDGFGSGDLVSAGGGLRASLGHFDVAVEAAVPVKVTGDGATAKATRLNLSVARRF
jgi:hemolysin activation/secretion protein